MTIDPATATYLSEHALGRLATTAPDGSPQNKPVGYHFAADRQVIEVAGFGLEGSAKFRNLTRHPTVAFVVDDVVGAGAEGTRFVEVRGRAERVVVDEPTAPGHGDHAVSSHRILIHPHRVVAWNVDPDEPGLRAYDVEGDHGRSDAEGDPDARPRQAPGEAPTAARPTLGVPAPFAAGAAAAVDAFVAGLQAGIESADAERYNRQFAHDVIWGSPFGRTVAGYDVLHPIHERLHREGVAGPASRYEVVQVLVPTADVALAHVRRQALGADGQPADEDGSFSEMALYALVRRDGDWWLAAGQNTPIAT